MHLDTHSGAFWSGLVRLGRLAELERLAEIEIDAARALVEAGAAPPGELSATPRFLMELSHSERLLFVAADRDDQPLGFLAGAERNGALYIGEVDVLRRLHGRGIGRALIQAVLAEARRRGFWGAMLTTDRHVPFNRPFYARLGFCETALEEMPPSLAAVLGDEMERGFDPARRLGMVLRFDTGFAAGAVEGLSAGWVGPEPSQA